MHTLISKTAPMLTIARYTVKGYIKERVLLVVLIFAFVLMISSYVLAPLAVGAQRKVIIDIGLASISLLAESALRMGFRICASPRELWIYWRSRLGLPLPCWS